MDDQERLKHLLRSLSVGVALVDSTSLAVVFENAKFFEWFPPVAEGDDGLGQRLPGLNVDRALGRLRQQRTFSYECETRAGARALPLTVEIRALPEGLEAGFLVECRDASKQKQAEYMLESYSKMAEKHTRDLQKEKDRVEKLLLNIMPKAVYEEMKNFGTATPQRFESASVLMLDFVGFTDMAVARDPSALISELNDIFSAFDRIVELFGCERIKTIGDAYMAVSGIPEAVPDHAHNIAKVALRMRRYLERRNAAHPEQWRCRIGINAGPLIGSIVGVQKYVYDIFGPGVNLAARMEAWSEPMAITLCAETRELIKDDFLFTDRGEFEVKGFGKKHLYFLDGEVPGRG
jgi:class 3 adenylate cyclase